MMKFNWPYLIILLPLPLLLYILKKYFLSSQNQKIESNTNNGLIVPFYSEILDYSNQSTTAIKKNTFKSLLQSIIWTLLILASMRPVFLDDPITLPVPTHDIIMAIDISGSMQSEDMSDKFRQTRLDVVKRIAHSFIDKRNADRIGLVFFGTQAFLSSPLTLDQKSLHSFLEKSQIGFAGQKTAIGDAIGLAVKRLKIGNNTDNTRFIILLSDGSNTSGDVDPLEAAKIAAQNNIKIYTIGIGKNSNNIFDIQSGMDLDEETLKKIATMTNGVYFHATSSHALAQIYQEINILEPITADNKVYRPVTEYFIYPLAIALFISMLLGLTNTKLI